MKKTKISLLILAVLSSNALFASNIAETIKPVISSAELNSNYNIINDLKKINDYNSRINMIKSEIKKRGDFTTNIKFSEVKSVNVPLLPLLLTYGFEKEAIKLIKDEDLKPFQMFLFEGNEQSDMTIAMDNNQVDYLQNSLKFIPDINKQYKYNNENGFYLLMHAAIKKDENTYAQTTLLLENGANENLQTFNNMTAERAAEHSNNREFLEALYAHKQNLNNDKDFLKKNAPLSGEHKSIQIGLIKNLKNGQLESLKNKNELFKYLNRFIIMGYNDAADILLEELKKDDSFNVNLTTKSGLSPLMAASMSELSGGNVEYARILIDMGANVNYKNKGISVASIAVARDNYKVLSLLLISGINPLEKNSNDHYLFEQALSQTPKATRSAYILKEILKSIVTHYQENQ
jgi:ankyrin repeat protein